MKDITDARKNNAMSNLSFGKRLRTSRIAKGLTQDELGKRIGLSGNSISQYEAGRAYPRQKPFGLLIKELEVTSSYLLTGDDPKEKIKAQTRYEKELLEIMRKTTPQNQKVLLDAMHALSQSLDKKKGGN